MKSTLAERVLARFSGLAGNPLGALLIRIIVDLARADIADRSMTLAAQLFTSLLPVIILLSTVPGATYFDAGLTHLHLTAADLRLPVAADADVSFTVFGVVGALMVLASATSFSRAINRMYAAIWQVPKLGLGDWWRWLAVIVLIALTVVVQGYAVLLSGVPTVGRLLAVCSTFALWTGCWWTVVRLSVKRLIPARQLLLTGLLTGFGVTVLLTGSVVVMPRILRTAADELGTLGIVFAAISWLFVYFYIVVTVAVIAHAITPGSESERRQRAKATLLQQLSELAQPSESRATNAPTE